MKCIGNFYFCFILFYLFIYVTFWEDLSFFIKLNSINNMFYFVFQSAKVLSTTQTELYVVSDRDHCHTPNLLYIVWVIVIRERGSPFLLFFSSIPTFVILYFIFKLKKNIFVCIVGICVYLVCRWIKTLPSYEQRREHCLWYLISSFLTASIKTQLIDAIDRWTM